MLMIAFAFVSDKAESSDAMLPSDGCRSNLPGLSSEDGDSLAEDWLVLYTSEVVLSDRLRRCAFRNRRPSRCEK